MKRIAYSLISVALILSPLLAGWGERLASVPVHYYLYEFSEGDDSCAVIIEIATDQPELPGEEFTEVSREELIEKGYYTTEPSMAFSDHSFGHSSGITRTFVRGSTTRRRVTCQSETNRINTLGDNRVIGETYRDGQLVYTWDSGWVWGLWIRYSYVRTYDAPPTYWWQQYGWHYWRTSYPVSEGRSWAKGEH